MKKACFIFYFDSSKEASIVGASLNPEIKHKIPKTNINVKISEKTLKMEIEAKNLSSLRAACNSYLRWINTAINVKKTV